MSLEERGGPANPNAYLVAARLADGQPYALVYHTALELHGVAHSPSETVHVGVTKQLFVPFTHDGVEYRPRVLEPWEVEECTTEVDVEGQTVRVTDRETTLVHCAQCPRWSGGPEEVLRSVGVWPSIDAERVLEITKRLGKPTAFHRVGFVLDHHRKRWGVNASVLGAFRAHVRAKSPDYWGTTPGADNRFDKNYPIVYPASLEGLHAA